MASVNIKYSDRTRSKFDSGGKLEVSMEMNASSAMMFSTNDALCSNLCKHVNNRERVEFATLCVSEESISCLKVVRHETLFCLILYRKGPWTMDHSSPIYRQLLTRLLCLLNSLKMNSCTPSFHRYTCPVTLKKGDCDCRYGDVRRDQQGLEGEDGEEMDTEEEPLVPEKTQYSSWQKGIPERRLEPKKDTEHHVAKKARHDDRKGSERKLGGDRNPPKSGNR